MSSSVLPTRRLPRAERREAILAAARRLLAERPYEAVSMSDIVRAAGVSRPVVYDHFPTKQSVVIALIRRHHEAVFEALAATASGAGVRDESDYRALLDTAFAHFESDPGGWRLLCHEPSNDPEIAAVQRETRDEILALTAAAFGLPAGSEAVAEALRNAINGLFAWQRENPAVSRAELVDAAVALTWRGLGR